MQNGHTKQWSNDEKSSRLTTLLICFLSRSLFLLPFLLFWRISSITSIKLCVTITREIEHIQCTHTVYIPPIYRNCTANGTNFVHPSMSLCLFAFKWSSRPMICVSFVRQKRKQNQIAKKAAFDAVLWICDVCFYMLRSIRKQSKRMVHTHTLKWLRLRKSSSRTPKSLHVIYLLL